MNRPALLLVALALAACSNDPTRTSLTENVGEAFAACNAPEIRFMAGKHNFMTAFEPCGSNNFSSYAWSPDGTHLYFALTHGGYVMNAGADDKATATIPSEAPIAGAVWLSNTRLAFPIGAAEGAAHPRLVLYDLAREGAAAMSMRDLTGITEPRDLHVGERPSELLFTAVQGEKRKIVRLDLDTGTIDEPFAWASALEVETFTYQRARDTTLIGAGGKVTLYEAEGKADGEWMPAKRGVLHPTGRWLALEHDGEAISIFYQRTWDELSERTRARELARAKEFESRLPAWYPREVQPPTITLVDRLNGERWMFTGFSGDHFAWYEARDYYASLVLWGFEGKEMNRNVLLGNLADRMKSMEKGEEMLGVQRWQRPAEDAPGAPAPEAAPE